MIRLYAEMYPCGTSRGKIVSMAIRLELGLSAAGKAVAVGGKPFTPNAAGVGKGYPAVGSNQAGNIKRAAGRIRLNHDGTFSKFEPDSAEEFAAVVAADEATGTD